MGAPAAAGEIVTKSQFAELVKRDPAFVSRAIASGKIHGEALIGEGSRARIVVAVALSQLGKSLDLGQQLAQQAPILPGDAPTGSGDLVERAEADAAELGGIHGDRARQVQLRNRKLEAELLKQEIDLRERAGELVEASAVAAALRRQLGPLVATFDEVPPAVSKAIADAYGLPYSEVLITVKGALRQSRDAWATRAAALAASAEADAA
jgi:hypothetical protein